jgi:hypothetical protein
MKINRPNKITALACSALLAVATTGLSQNLPVNPGFEADAPGSLTGWSVNNGGTTSAAYARSGTKSLLIDSTGVGQWWSPNVFQTFPAVPGDEFYLSGYMLTPAGVAGGSFGLFKIEFRDAANTIIQPASVSIGGNAAAPFYGAESTPTMNNTSPANTWIFSQTKAVAPANTATVWFYALNVNAVDNLMYFDDIVATNVPVPPSTASISSPANGATVTPSFTINATASLPSGVASVEFFTNNVSIGIDTDAPYSLPVVGAADGSLALKVVAHAVAGPSVASSVVTVTVVSTAKVYVDPSKNWVGYLNYFATPQNGGGYEGGMVWGTADLKASFSGSTLTLSPNSINDAAPEWYVTTTSPSVGNRMMEANMYVEPVGSLPGMTVTFTGMCTSDTMTTNAAFNGPANPAGNGWTCLAFVKDFAPDYSSSVASTIPLTNGMRFSVSLETINDPARHVQYGFITTGPAVWATDPVLPSYGKVVIAPGPAVAITPSVSGANVNLSFSSVTGYTYTAQFKNNLTDANWNNLGAATNGTGSTIVLTDTHALPNRFYRLSVQ